MRMRQKEKDRSPVLGICFLQLFLKLNPVDECFKIPYVVVQHHQHLLKQRMEWSIKKYTYKTNEQWKGMLSI